MQLFTRVSPNPDSLPFPLSFFSFQPPCRALYCTTVLWHCSPLRETQRQGQQTSCLEVFEAFLPLSTLEKLRAHINKVLLAKMKPPCSTSELQGVIILHVLAASYNTSVSIIKAPENKAYFCQMRIHGSRYKEVWSALSGTRRK